MPRTLDNLRDPRRRGGYLLAIGGTMLAVLLAELVQPLVGAGELSLVFMLVVLAVAAQTHAGPAVLTAVLCFLAYNFFFAVHRRAPGRGHGAAVPGGRLAGRAAGFETGHAGAGAAQRATRCTGTPAVEPAAGRGGERR
jgi:putative copper export protein